MTVAAIGVIVAPVLAAVGAIAAMAAHFTLVVERASHGRCAARGLVQPAKPGVGHMPPAQAGRSELLPFARASMRGKGG